MLVALPIAMMVPPCSTNALSCGIVFAPVMLPTLPAHSGGRFAGGAFRGPSSLPASTASSVAGMPPVKIITSYFALRFPASSCGGYTTSKFVNWYCCSNIHRIQPDGMSPPY